MNLGSIKSGSTAKQTHRISSDILHESIFKEVVLGMPMLTHHWPFARRKWKKARPSGGRTSPIVPGFSIMNTGFSHLRSSTVKYSTFVAANRDGEVEPFYADEIVRFGQIMMGLLYDMEAHAINYNLNTGFAKSEMQEASVSRNFRITEALRQKLWEPVIQPPSNQSRRFPCVQPPGPGVQSGDNRTLERAFGGVLHHLDLEPCSLSRPYFFP